MWTRPTRKAASTGSEEPAGAEGRAQPRLPAARGVRRTCEVCERARADGRRARAAPRARELRQQRRRGRAGLLARDWEGRTAPGLAARKAGVGVARDRGGP